MTDSHKNYFRRKIEGFVDVDVDSKENFELLFKLVPDDILIKFCGQLDWVLDNIENMKANGLTYKALYNLFNGCKEQKMMEEILGTAFAINKKARIFYYYYILRKYQDNEINNDSLDNVLNNIQEYIRYGADLNDIKEFLEISNTGFSEYKDEVLEFIKNENVYTVM